MGSIATPSERPASVEPDSRADPAPRRLLREFNATPERCRFAFDRMSRVPFVLDDTVRSFGWAGVHMFTRLPTTFLFEVLSPVDGSFAGLLGAVGIVPGRRADLQIHIWDRAALGRRWDRQIGWLALAFGFSTFALARMTACIPAANVLSCKYAERLGLVAEGRMVRAFRFDNTWHDGILYRALPEEVFAAANTRAASLEGRTR